MARKHLSWKQEATKDPGYKSWIMGSKDRDLDKSELVAKRVSEALKGIWNKYDRQDKAKVFARRMERAAERVKENGPRSYKDSLLPHGIVMAMCWGVGSGHALIIRDRYKAAAKAARRFCEPRFRAEYT